MSVTISKGRLFRVTVAVDDSRLEQMKKAPEAAAKATQAGAEYWHSGVLPGHFKFGAAQKYGYVARQLTYLRDPRKSGKPSLVFSGSLRQDLVKRAQFKEMAGGATEIKMWARVLNLAPSMPQNSEELVVKRSNGKDYPNLKREAKALTLDEYEAITKVVNDDLAASFAREDAMNEYYGA